MVRWPVVRHIEGRVLPLDVLLRLRDISTGGFSGAASIKLTHGAAYDLRFALCPQAVVLKARLAHAMRISSDEEMSYLLGFEFVDTKWDEAAIDALITEATGDRLTVVSRDSVNG
jgi:hypothetical protein